MVGVGHTVALDSVYGGVGLSSRTVVLGSVNVNHQWLAGHLLGMDAGRIGEPVVTMDDVEINCAGNDACGDRVIVDFFENIVGVASSRIRYIPGRWYACS